MPCSGLLSQPGILLPKNRVDSWIPEKVTKVAVLLDSGLNNVVSRARFYRIILE